MSVKTEQHTSARLTPALVSEDAFRWPQEPLAKGGMAVVYEGEDRRLARRVILKAPREDVDVPEGMEDVLSERLVAESRVLARLQHPSIVTIYEMGRATTGTPFCVLEKVEGRALRDILEELDEAELDGKPRTRERMELLQSMVAIGEALAYAHERGVVHRDVTPNNILIGARGEPTLIDWGLAKDIGAAVEQAAIDPRTAQDGETLIAGTPPYVSFEQSRGKPADPSYDVYSFGVTLYEVVSGRTPFPWMTMSDSLDREKRLERFMRWLEKEHEAPPAIAGDRELSGILARAIAHDPADRFTADELLRALKQYLTGELVFSHRYSVIGRVARWVRRRRGLAISLMGMFLAIVAAVIVTLALFASRSRNAQVRAELAAQSAAEAQHAAELEAIAAASQLDASDKARAASDAAAAAQAAEARAQDAEHRGENADALRAEAEKQKKLAVDAQSAAQDAAKQAQTDASDAEKQRTEAMAARDSAEAARDSAVADEQKAQQDLATARAGEKVADDARAQAEQSLAQEKAARQAAEQAASTAQSDKVASDEAKARAEADLAAAQKQVTELQAKVKELQSSGGSAGGGGGAGSASAAPAAGSGSASASDTPATSP